MVTLPVVAATAKSAEPDTTESDLPAAKPQTGIILLVEDEEPLRELLAEVLTKEGHTVIAKSTAQEALAWASGDVARPDLLLTDYDLYGSTNGLKLAQDLPDVLGGSVPSIILTGDITTQTMKRIAESPIEQITKPVMPEILLAHVSDLMRKARSEQVKSTRRAVSARTQVHVVDDDPMIREATRRLFEAEGWMVSTYRSAEEFLEAPRPEGDACLLVDNLLPGMNGVALVAQLRTQRSQMPAVMLTGHGDAATAVAAFKAGVSDLIEKPASAADLLRAVRDALHAKTDARPLPDSRHIAQKQFADLTAREREVMALVLAGEPNKIIAHELGINQRTVENHRASVMRKTGAASLPALVRLALAADTQFA